MALTDVSGLVVGAVALGVIHGAEPGHGWPVAAAYAFERGNEWLAGLVGGLVIGVGHLLSSLAVVGAFFLLKARLDLQQVSEPLHVAGVEIGSPLGVVAGTLLILLGVREYRGGGHTHGHGGDDGHSHGQSGDDANAQGDVHHHSNETDDHAHSHEHGHGHGHAHDHSTGGGLLARLRALVPFCDRDSGRVHHHDDLSADEGLSGIAVSAFVLGFAHEEEFEIIAICAGTDHCLLLMTAYALTVIAVITGLTLLLVAGYEAFEPRMERYAAHFPTLSAVVLVAMGAGFVLGLF